MIRLLERDIQRACMDYLNTLHGVRVWRANVGGRSWVDKTGHNRVMKFGERGQSDLTGVGPGGVRIEIEIKRPGLLPSPEQAEWLREMDHFGAVAFWCDSFESCQAKFAMALSGKLQAAL